MTRVHLDHLKWVMNEKLRETKVNPLDQWVDQWVSIDWFVGEQEIRPFHTVFFFMTTDIDAFFQFPQQANLTWDWRFSTLETTALWIRPRRQLPGTYFWSHAAVEMIPAYDRRRGAHPGGLLCYNLHALPIGFTLRMESNTMNTIEFNEL